MPFNLGAAAIVDVAVLVGRGLDAAPVMSHQFRRLTTSVSCQGILYSLDLNQMCVHV